MIEVYIANAPWLHWGISPGVQAAADNFIQANSIEPNKVRFIIACRFSVSSAREMDRLVGSIDSHAAFEASQFEVYRWRPDTLQVEMALIVAH